MDPWAKRQSDVSASKNIILTKFEDNFIPDLSNKLPDHEQYLAILEAKLKKLKSDPNVLRQLEAKREACMRQLLSGEPECNRHQLLLEEPITDSPLLRTILPQKQALSQGEIVEFIKYDQLQKEGDDQELSRNQEEDKSEGQSDQHKH